MDILMMAGGLTLLLFGRKLFWLAVACIGMVTGIAVAEPFLAQQSTIFILAIGLIAAILGALLAIFVQRLAVGVAGFLGGGYFGLAVFQMASQSPDLQWVFYLVGGMIGAILVMSFFDWALIGITSLVGAAMVVQSFSPESAIAVVLLLFMALVGASIQSRQMIRAGT